MARKVAIALAVTLLAGLGGAGQVAAAGAPTPPVALPAVIDNPSFYEKQTVCDPVARPGSLAVKQLLLDTYGPATVYIPRACSGSISEHFDGRAVDWMRNVRVPAERAQAEAFLAWVLAPGPDGTPMEMARRLGIMYLIWNNRMIRSYDPGRGWTNYRNCLAAGRGGTGLDTSCHRNHIHISLSWDGAAQATSWWTGAALTQPYCSKGASGASPGAGSPAVVADASAVPGLVATSPTVVLDTLTGVGAPTACRLLAGRTLPVSVLPAISGTDARVVAVRVDVHRSNAPAAVSVWSSGRSMPKGQVSAPQALDSTTTMLVPVSSLGTIGVATSLGSTNLTVTVLGYLTADLPGAGARFFAPPGRTQAPAPAPVAPPAEPAPSAQPTVAGINLPGAAALPVAGTRPSKPRNLKVRARKGAVVISWSAPASAGTHPITGYRVAALFSPKQVVKVASSCETDGTARSCAITGLKKGRTYWMSLRATNAVGSTWAAKKKVRAK